MYDLEVQGALYGAGKAYVDIKLGSSYYQLGSRPDAASINQLAENVINLNF